MLLLSVSAKLGRPDPCPPGREAAGPVRRDGEIKAGSARLRDGEVVCRHAVDASYPISRRLAFIIALVTSIMFTLAS